MRFSTDPLRYLLTVMSPGGRRRGRLLIFIFHQVLETRDDLLAGEPTLVEFEEKLRWIAHYCNVLPLSQALDMLREGALPSRAASITFDDGYANNLSLAEPALNRAGVTATVFLAVDAIRRGLMWNDIVREAVRRGAGELNAEDLDLGHHRWTVGDRDRVLDSLLQKLKYRAYSERLEQALDLYSRCTDDPLPRLTLTEAEIRGYQGRTLEFGAHTVNHPILCEMSDPDAFDEIRASRDWLAELRGAPPRLFAYPNGKRGVDYNAAHAKMVEDLGFRCALTTEWGYVDKATSMFEVPRISPWDGTRFRYGLRLAATHAGV